MKERKRKPGEEAKEEEPNQEGENTKFILNTY